MSETDYKLFLCVQCGFEYDEAKGWPEDGIAPGTRWDDIPEDWSCPDCGASPVRDPCRVGYARACEQASGSLSRGFARAVARHRARRDA